MLNLVMTHSPRVAAIATNKPYGPDSESTPSIQHRMAWLRRSRMASNEKTAPAPERVLRERTA